jgi:hypothetical protein
LPWESFWLVFQYYAFGTTNVVTENNQTLLLTGEQIAKKLDGLPLAAKVMGNLLRSRLNVDVWVSIMESDWWDLSEAVSPSIYGNLLPRTTT